MKVSVGWPTDWRDWWDADHSTGTSDNFSLGVAASTEYGTSSFKQTINFKRCTGDLLGFIESGDGDSGKIGELMCKYKQNKETTWIDTAGAGESGTWDKEWSFDL
eukprot:scpid104208/ scgid18581/ 